MSFQDLNIKLPTGKFPIGARVFSTNHVLLQNTADGWKIVEDPLDRDIPGSLRAPGFHRPFKQSLLDFVALPDDQKAKYDTDGETVLREGWLPNGVYVTKSGEKINVNALDEARIALENAALAFHDALAGIRR